jgi:signal transducing adaptor molecule
VLELSKQDKGGRNAVPAYVAAAQGGSSSSRTQAAPQAQSQPPYYPQQQQQQAPAYSAPLPPVPEPEAPLDVNTATRVRALYAFATTEVGELSFERGDVIKVLDRGFKEWWRGACNGKIGVSNIPQRCWQCVLTMVQIFPVTYVEALAEPSPRELQDEAQEEARVFASLGECNAL